MRKMVREMKKKAPVKRTAKTVKAAPKPAKEKKRVSALPNGLKGLELSFEEAIDSFRRKQESRLALLRDHADGKTTAAKPGKGSPVNEKKISSKIAGLKVKPKKGRAKDLLRIEKLLEELMALIPQE